jgi:hypothetical protein
LATLLVGRVLLPQLFSLALFLVDNRPLRTRHMPAKRLKPARALLAALIF